MSAAAYKFRHSQDAVTWCAACVLDVRFLCRYTKAVGGNAVHNYESAFYVKME